MAFLRRNRGFFLFAAIALLLPAFISDTYYLSILAFMATRLMIVVGLALLMGQAGQISLGHAAFVGIGAYGAAILTTKAGLDPWLAMVAAALMAAGVAAVIGIPTLKLKGHYLAMATLGFNEIAFILMVQLKSLTNGTDGITGIPSLRLGPIDFGQPRLYHLLVWGVALLIFLFSLNLAGIAGGPGAQSPAPLRARGGRVGDRYLRPQAAGVRDLGGVRQYRGFVRRVLRPVHQPRLLHHHVLRDLGDQRRHRWAGAVVGAGVGDHRHRGAAGIDQAGE